MINLRIVHPLVSSASGAVADTVASRNAHGQYFKVRVVPNNPNTPLQARKRRLFRATVRAWKGFLTQVHRDAWDAYAVNLAVHARIRVHHPLTGRQLWLRLNLMRSLAGLSYYAFPPTAFTAAWHLPYVLSMTAPSSLITLTWLGQQPMFGDTYSRIFCHNTTAHPSTVNSFVPPYNWRFTLIPSGAPPYTWGSGTVVNTGDRVFVRLVTMWGDGRLSPAWRWTVIVS